MELDGSQPLPLGVRFETENPLFQDFAGVTIGSAYSSEIHVMEYDGRRPGQLSPSHKLAPSALSAG